MMVLNNEIIISQNIGFENTNRLISYRSFVREVLLTNLLFTLRIPSRHIRGYIFLSQLEYVHMYIIVSKCSISGNKEFKNVYDILFMTLPDFGLKLSFASKHVLGTWDQAITFNGIRTNYIIVEMICQQPGVFKRALRKNVLRIFNQKTFRFSGLSKLKETICNHIDKLDERDPCLMAPKAHAIYKFIRLRLLENA
ncbi:hypothetical protein THOM_3021 [Trachipleistophora hominis]|uniref:Uncharacterized protein n=1 Tax=Trachipleistophora hominis TaxID=72359 RepID=L7JRL1_TRAHO|nr:hypothetical protein THOM_3021 [Trachipleistophora hominis]